MAQLINQQKEATPMPEHPMATLAAAIQDLKWVLTEMTEDGFANKRCRSDIADLRAIARNLRARTEGA